MTRAERKRLRQLEVRDMATRYLKRFRELLDEFLAEKTYANSEIVGKTFQHVFIEIQKESNKDRTRVNIYRDACSLFMDEAVDSINETAPNFFNDVEGLKADLNKSLNSL